MDAKCKLQDQVMKALCKFIESKKENFALVI